MTRVVDAPSATRDDTSSVVGAVAIAVAIIVILGFWLGFSKVLWLAGSTVLAVAIIGFMASKVEQRHPGGDA